MEALQKLRKQRAAARMRVTMITASEHCAKCLGANTPPRITTKPCSAPCCNLWSGAGCQALCFVSLLSKVCSELKDTLYWFNKCLHCWKSVECWEGWTVEKKTRAVKPATPIFTCSWYQQSLPCFWRETEHFAFVIWIIMDGCGRGLAISGSDALCPRVWQRCRAACSVWEHMLFPSQQQSIPS